MRAIVLEIPGKPLRETELPEPEPGPGQVRVRVEACGVCRTDLHIVAGELREPKLPLVLGLQIVGVVDAVGDECQGLARSLGPGSVGAADALPAEPRDGAMVVAPVGALVPAALRALGRGGVVICAGTLMSAIPSFPNALLWEERAIRSDAS